MSLIGRRIGNYEIKAKIGEGGMGTVYLGEHPLIGKRVAIKVLLEELVAKPDVVSRFFNEAKAVNDIGHLNIVDVVDFGKITGDRGEEVVYFIMEFLDGEALSTRIRRAGLPFKDTLHIMQQCCSALAASHAKGIVHRDLKPENIFVVGDPAVTGGERAKILDFGIAKLTGDDPGKLKTRTGMVMGTPVYMSPEQCRGAGEVDQRSDIYSMGCVLMTMLTGTPPFDGEGSGELIAAHLREPPPLAASRVAGLPEILDQILQRCLAKSPADRFQSMSELAMALGHAEALVASTMTPTQLGSFRPTPVPGMAPVQPTPTTLAAATGQTSRPPASGKRGLIVGLVSCVAVVGGVALYLAGRSGSRPAVPAAAAAGSSSPDLSPAQPVPPAPPPQQPAPVAAHAAIAAPAAAPADAGVDASASPAEAAANRRSNPATWFAPNVVLNATVMSVGRRPSSIVAFGARGT